MSLFGARHGPGTETLPLEGHLPGFDGAIGWLNSEPLTPDGAAREGGSRRLLDLHLHQLAADGSLREGLGGEVPRPGPRGDRRAHAGVPVRARGRERPLGRARRCRSTIRSRSTATTASGRRSRTEYWPALYLADAEGALRYHHFGEGHYEESRTGDPGAARASTTSSSPSRRAGIEAQADWDHARVSGDVRRLRAGRAFRVTRRRRRERAPDHTRPRKR